MSVQKVIAKIINKLTVWQICLISLVFFLTNIFLFYKYLVNDTYKLRIANVLNKLVTGQIPANYLFLLVLALPILLIMVVLVRYNLEKIQKFFSNSDHVKWILGIYLIVFFSLFVWVAYRKYLNMATGIYDFGLEQQVVWNTSQGRLFQATVEVKNYLGDHFSLITLLPSAIYYFVPSALTLFVIQTLAFVISVVGIFYCGKYILKNSGYALMWSVFFSVAYGLAGLLLYDYHPISLVLPFLTWGLYFYLRSNYRLTALLFILASLCKEDVGLFVAAFGLYLLFKKKKQGIFFLLYGITISFLALFVFIPYFRGGASSDTLLRYAYLGQTPVEMLKTIVLNPSVLLKQILDTDHLKYILKIFMPAGFLSLFAPLEAIMILPSLFVNLLSRDNFQISAMVQYDAVNIVAITFSAMYGFARIVNSDKRPIIKNLLVSVLLVINVFFLFGHQVISQYNDTKPRYEDHLFITEFKHKIPEDAVVSVTYFVGGQYGETKNLQLFYPDYGDYDAKPDVIIIDKFAELPNPDLERKIADLLAKNYHTELETNSFLIILRNGYQLN